MIPSYKADALTDQEVSKIHGNVLKILSEVGVEVQNEELLTLLADSGAEVDMKRQRACFSEQYIEDFLTASSDEFDDVEGLEVTCLFPYLNSHKFTLGCFL